MAISLTTTTQLPLSEWARLMGYSQQLFHGIAPFDADQSAGCQGIFYQDQNQEWTISREEVAQAINDAETVLAEIVNYSLLPDWFTSVVPTPRFYQSAYTSVLTVQGRPKSVQLPQRYIHELGRRASVLITADAAITRVDNNGDGFAETCQLTVATTVNDNEIHIYYPSEGGDPNFEIRPITVYDHPTILGSKVVEWPVWLAVAKANLYITQNLPLNPNDSIYLTDVDIYRVYNDDTTPINLVYEPNDCLDCGQTFVASCGFVKDAELGFVTYNPTYLTSVNCRTEPDKVEVNYYAGYRNPRQTTQTLVKMDSYWATAVARFATGMLDADRLPMCAGNQDNLKMITKWSEPYATSVDMGKGSFKVPDAMLDNPTGIETKGAVYAWQRAKRRHLP